MKPSSISPRLKLILTMMLFGTIGLFSRFNDLPASITSCGRAILGALVILLSLSMKKIPLDTAAIRRNARQLILSSIFLSINWVLLFESYRYTTIAVASLCYYMEPVFLMLAAPLLFKERLSVRKVLCILIAFTGMIFVTGVLQTGFHFSELRGAIYALIAAAFYTANVITNMKFRDISVMDSTAAQLILAGIILLPYILISVDPSTLAVNTRSVLIVILLGIVHTGIAYTAYYGSVAKLQAQTVAVLSYVDPVESVLLSALVLAEGMTLPVAIGAVLILGATMISEIMPE